jgi:hypothetical protein
MKFLALNPNKAKLMYFGAKLYKQIMLPEINMRQTILGHFSECQIIYF